MRLLDRYIVKSFLFNYLLAFVVLVGTYILLDLIINLNSFSKESSGLEGMALLVSMLRDMFDYYIYHVLVIFQQVSGAIPLLAAGFTMVRMTRHNELAAILASGVSLYRVALPIVLCAVGFSLLVIVDQEVFMPAVSDKLLRKHGEVRAPAGKGDPVYFVRDRDGSLLIAKKYDPVTQRMEDVRIIEREEVVKDQVWGAAIGRKMADEAIWDPDYEDGGVKGGWRMQGNYRQIDDTNQDDPAAKLAESRPYAYRQTTLTPAQLELLLSKKAVEFLSSAQIALLSQNSPPPTRAGLEKIMHTRFTQPVMNVVMLLLGIPFLLTREPKRLVVNMIYCTIISGICFVATFVFFQMAGNVVTPLLGAWLPVLAFGPLAVVMLDWIKT